MRLERVRTRLTEASDDLSASLSAAAQKRLDQADRRVARARDTQSL